MDEWKSPTDLSTFRLRKRTPGTFVLVPFPKQGRSIRCQGQLEAAAARVLAACPLVKGILEQPQAIHYAWSDATTELTLLNGPPTKEFRKKNRCSYVVPDFLVSFVCGRKRLVEIKPSHKLARPLTQRKLQVARLFAAAQDWTYHVVTERELLAGPLLANVRLLGRFRQLQVDPIVLKRIEDSVAAEVMTLAELSRRIDSLDASALRAAVFHLVACGRLSLDVMKEPISPATLIFPERRSLWDPFVSAWEPSGCTTNGATGSSVSSTRTRSSPKMRSFEWNERSHGTSSSRSTRKDDSGLRDLS